MLLAHNVKCDEDALHTIWRCRIQLALWPQQTSVSVPVSATFALYWHAINIVLIGGCQYIYKCK